MVRIRRFPPRQTPPVAVVPIQQLATERSARSGSRNTAVVLALAVSTARALAFGVLTAEAWGRRFLRILAAMKIYTRTGDAGSTALFGGTRVLKNDPRVAAYGDVDELNACLGLARAQRDLPAM